jgi:hypothetical protein
MSNYHIINPDDSISNQVAHQLHRMLYHNTHKAGQLQLSSQALATPFGLCHTAAMFDHAPAVCYLHTHNCTQPRPLPEGLCLLAVGVCFCGVSVL